MDYTLNVDFGRLGRWPGRLLKLHVESSFGNSAKQKAEAIVPVNGESLFPVPDESETTLTSRARVSRASTPRWSPASGCTLGNQPDAPASRRPGR